MSDIEYVKGEMLIKEDNWYWTPKSLTEKNAQRLARDLRFVKRVNPATGITFMRHLPKAEGCSAHLEDPDKYAKCVIEMIKL